MQFAVPWPFKKWDSPGYKPTTDGNKKNMLKTWGALDAVIPGLDMSSTGISWGLMENQL